MIFTPNGGFVRITSNPSLGSWIADAFIAVHQGYAIAINYSRMAAGKQGNMYFRKLCKVRVFIDAVKISRQSALGNAVSMQVATNRCKEASRSTCRIKHCFLSLRIDGLDQEISD